MKLQKSPNSIARGARVRVLTGSFRDRVGLYQGQSAREREIVLLTLLGRMVPVELNRIDKIEAAS